MIYLYRSEDEEFQEAVDLYTSGRLEESISLARESLRHSRENLIDAQQEDDDTEVEGQLTKLTKSCFYIYESFMANALKI